MEDNRYKVLIGDEVVATEMDIKTATILIKALFDEYYNAHRMTVSIKEMERPEAISDGG